ncbi:Low-specificity L-threonine aldolase [Staphylococcus aureus]|uniref:Low-specificity L-threonine aldolase n=1 Tax=Staphylococcus aureus TaxID=1280 RepID=A0A380DTB2_STAAU|nr:Low-specificity L-threonine aldolase [Staphylococcus aureus]
MLESYEGVISADTGHVAVHEGGAIEYSGHKVITIPSKEGKVSGFRC